VSVTYKFRLQGSDGKGYISSADLDATMARIEVVENETRLFWGLIWDLEKKVRDLEAPGRRDEAMRVLSAAGKMHNRKWLDTKAKLWWSDVDVLVAEGRVVEVRRGRAKMLALPGWVLPGPCIEYEPGYVKRAKP